MTESIPTPPPLSVQTESLRSKPISLWLAFFIPFGLLFGVSVPASILVNALSLSDRWLVAIIQVGAVILPTILLFRRYGLSMEQVTAAGRLRLWPLAGLGVCCAGLVVLADTVMHKSLEIAPTAWADSFRELMEIQARLMDVHDLAGYLWYIAVIVLGAGIFEELLFRGLILQAALQKMSVKAAIVLNGFLFGVMHQDLIGFFFYFSFGAILAYGAHRTGSLIYGMILHSLLNGSAMLVARRFGALERLPIPVWLAVFGGLAAMLFGALLFVKTTQKMPGPEGRSEALRNPPPAPSPE